MVFVTKKRIVSIFLLITVGLIFIIGSASLTTATANSVAVLWINPVSVDIEPGGTAQVGLQLDNVSNVYSAQISLDFDPSVVAVVDSDPGTGGVQISVGICPNPDFIVTNFSDNGVGTIEYAVTQLIPSPPCSGGEVASVEFQCITSDTSSDVSFTASIIGDPDGLAISHVTQNGTVTCLEDTPNKLYLPLIVKD